MPQRLAGAQAFAHHPATDFHERYHAQYQKRQETPPPERRPPWPQPLGQERRQDADPQGPRGDRRRRRGEGRSRVSLGRQAASTRLLPLAWCMPTWPPASSRVSRPRSRPPSKRARTRSSSLVQGPLTTRFGRRRTPVPRRTCGGSPTRRSSSRTRATQLKQMPMPQAIGVSSDTWHGTLALGGNSAPRPPSSARARSRRSAGCRRGEHLVAAVRSPGRDARPMPSSVLTRTSTPSRAKSSTPAR